MAGWLGETAEKRKLHGRFDGTFAKGRSCGEKNDERFPKRKGVRE